MNSLYEEFTRSTQNLRDLARSPLEDLARATHAMSARWTTDTFARTFADTQRPFRELERMLSLGGSNYGPNSHFLKAIDAARPREIDLARYELLALRSFRESLYSRFDLDRNAASLAKMFQSRPEYAAFEKAAAALRRNNLVHAFLHPAVLEALDVPAAFEDLEEDNSAPSPLTAEEATAAVDELGTAAREAETAVTTGDYGGLLGWIDRIKRQYPNLYVAFVIYITVFGVPVVEYEVQRAWEKFRAPKAAHVVERQVITTSSNVSNFSPDHRFITASRLIVRSEPRQASHVRGYLYEGEVVVSRQECGAWSLIRFEDGDVSIEGWIFTRYAKKFADRGSAIQQR